MPIYSDGHVVTAAEFNAMMPVGVILPYGGSAAPTGWLLCDGSAVSRTTYADLFSVIGTTFGAGDGSTTFNVPDSRGRVIVHKNTGTFSTVGGKGGEETHTLSAAEMPSHTHTGPSHTHSFSATTSSALSGDVVSSLVASGTSGAEPYDIISGVATAAHTHTVSGTTGSGGTGSTGSAGSGGAHNNLQPYMVLLGIIRY